MATAAAEQVEPGTDVEPRPKRRPAARRKTAAEPDTAAGPVADEVVVVPTRVIPAHLRFTTTTEPADDDQDDIAERTLPFELDGVELHIIVPRKLDEVLSQLVEANARRATTADALYAGLRFMSRVFAPGTVAHLQARLDNDDDVFDREKLFDIMRAVVDVLDDFGKKRGRQGGGRRGAGGRR